MQNSVAPVAAVSSRGLDQRRDVEPDGPHRRLEQAGLRAEVAVLRAAAGLQADDALDLDLRAAPAHPHLVGEAEQRRGSPRRAAAGTAGSAPATARGPRRAPGGAPGRGGRRRGGCGGVSAAGSEIVVTDRSCPMRRAKRRRLEAAAERGAQPGTRRRREKSAAASAPAPAGSAPSSGRAASISRSLMLLTAGQVRLCGPGPDDDAGRGRGRGGRAPRA